MNFFKKFYIPPSRASTENGSGDGESVNGEDATDSNRDICSPFRRTYLSPTLFTDSSAANEYVCKICHFMAVDPLEHVPGPNVTCSNIFCLPCVKTYAASGLSSCPAEGCLTSGFDGASLRELGTREIARLSNLTLKCEFNCSKAVPYRDYWTHREKCPANPENFCEICDTPKTCDTHSCREVFVKLKKKDESLIKENNRLKSEIDKLRRELDSLRGARAEKIINSQTSTTTYANNSDSQVTSNENASTTSTATAPTTSAAVSTTSEDNKNGVKTQQRTKPGPFKGNYRNGRSDFNNNNQTTRNQQSYSRDTSMDKASSSHYKSNGGDVESSGFLRGSVPQYKFHSNCYKIKPDSNKIRLIFHYGEKNYKIDEVLPTYTFRTLRSLLHDMMKHDPGIMLLVRHRTLYDRETVASCGFKPGFNSISLVPFDTPDFNDPGFRLGLYRLKHATDPLDAKKVPPETIKQTDMPFISKEAIDFYSNSLNPQPTEKDITLTFHRNGKDISLERVKRDQTIGSIRSMADYMIEGGAGKMMYITHQVIKDDTTVKQCGIGFGTIDITLLPTSFPIDLDNARTLHLLRFIHNGKLSKKLAGKMKSRTNSMASLV